METLFFEKLEYPEAMKLLEQLHEQVVAAPSMEKIVLTSHPPVLTLGRRAELHEILVDRWQRLCAGVGLFYTPRGGGATAHGPGQEVIYPVLSLPHHSMGVSEYIKVLAFSASRVLQGYGVDAVWEPERPGLYVKGKKIVSIGLSVSRGIVSHGMSVNIENPMTFPGINPFDMIVPCKATGLLTTSIKDVTGKVPPPWTVGRAIIEELRKKIGA